MAFNVAAPCDALFRAAGDMTGCSTSTSNDTSIALTAGGLERIK